MNVSPFGTSNFSSNMVQDQDPTAFGTGYAHGAHMFPSYPLAGLGAIESAPIAQDLTAASVAFGVPFIYDRWAKKKHKKRYGRVANVGAVVGLYFLTTFVFRSITGAN